MRNYKDNVIVKLTFQFALDIMDFSELLREQREIESVIKVLNKIIASTKKDSPMTNCQIG
jgi:hypothetical protein